MEKRIQLDVIVVQMAATHCNSLQLTATHCNSLQHTEEQINTSRCRHGANGCNSLQLTATRWEQNQWDVVAVQTDATHYNLLQRGGERKFNWIWSRGK